MYTIIGRCAISAFTFIETPLFEFQRKSLISDDEYTVLQTEIIVNPEKGKLIEGTGGLRKLRFAAEGTGKSGGYRVIYLLVQADFVHMITIYKKGKKENLTKAEKNQFKKLVEILKEENK